MDIDIEIQTYIEDWTLYQTWNMNNLIPVSTQAHSKR